MTLKIYLANSSSYILMKMESFNSSYIENENDSYKIEELESKHINFRVSGQKINTTTSVKYVGRYKQFFYLGTILQEPHS